MADRPEGQLRKSPNGKRHKKKTSFENDGINENDSANGFNTDNLPQHLRLKFSDLVRLLLQNGSILNASFIVSLFALSIGMSVVESLIFLYFEFLGGSTMMCGLTVCVTVLFELPLFHYAPAFLEWLGSTTMLQLGCDIWNHIWLEKEERQIVHHRMKSGHWVHKGDVEQMVKEDAVS